MLELDHQLMLLLNTDAFPFMDKVMWYASEKYTWVPVYLILLFYLYRKYPGKRYILIVVFIAICIALNDQTASGLFKNWVQRLRPSYDPSINGLLHYVTEPNGNVYKGGKFGFYSSHAANYAGIVTLVLFWLKPLNKFAIFLLISWCILIGYSRIYLGVHFPTDVLMGWAMGALYGALCFLLWRKSDERLFKSV